MIIAIVSQRSDAAKTLLATNLAVLSAQAGNKTLLVDADPRQCSAAWSNRRRVAGLVPSVSARTIAGKSMQPELENLSIHFDNIMIDTEARDCMASRSALVSAHAVVLLAHPGEANQASRENLIKRIETARLFNPSLQVFIMAACPSTSTQDLTASRVLVARIPTARLIETAFHEDAAIYRAFGDGLSIAESDAADESAVSQMTGIYREVAGSVGVHRRSPLSGIFRAIRLSAST